MRLSQNERKKDVRQRKTDHKKSKAEMELRMVHVLASCLISLPARGNVVVLLSRWSGRDPLWGRSSRTELPVHVRILDAEPQRACMQKMWFARPICADAVIAFVI